MNHKKGFSKIIIIIVAIVLASAVGYFAWTQNASAPDEQAQNEEEQTSQVPDEQPENTDTECSSNTDCQDRFVCYFSQICSSTLDGIRCSNQMGDEMCHQACESDNDCGSSQKCVEKGIFRGDVGSSIKFCE